MIRFDSSKNSAEAFDVSGYINVFIDGELFSKFNFDQAIKVGFVFNKSPAEAIAIKVEKEHFVNGNFVQLGCRRISTKNRYLLSQKDSYVKEETFPHSNSSHISLTDEVEMSHSCVTPDSSSALQQSKDFNDINVLSANKDSGVSHDVSDLTSPQPSDQHASRANLNLTKRTSLSADCSADEVSDDDYDMHNEKLSSPLDGPAEPEMNVSSVALESESNLPVGDEACMFISSDEMVVLTKDLKTLEEINKCCCKFCGKTFESKLSRDTHILKFSFVELTLLSDQGICPLCLVVLDQSDVNEHFDSVHFENKLYSCCVCYKQFKLKKEWLDHSSSKHANVKAEILPVPCNKLFSQSNIDQKSSGSSKRTVKTKRITQHSNESQNLKVTPVNLAKNYFFAVQNSKENEIQCKYCNEKLSPNLLYNHLKQKPPNRHTCRKCGEISSSEAASIIHDIDEHGPGLEISKSNGEPPTTQCPMCPKRKLTSLLIYHVRSEHTHEFLYKCCVCMKVCMNVSDMKRHCEKIHTYRPPTKEFKCYTCGQIFETRSEYALHKGVHRKICCFCGEKFEMERLLNQHYYEKHEDSLFPCSHCERKFPTKSAVETHKIYARRTRLEPCPKCGLMLKNVKKHMKLQHPSEDTTLQCTVCGKIVKNETRLSFHMVTHQDRKLACGLCSKVFKNSKAFDSHQRYVHFKTKTKAYECQVCSKSFVSKSNLNTHMRIHSDVKMFPCDFCPKGFNTKASLQYHMRSQHPNELLP